MTVSLIQMQLFVLCVLLGNTSLTLENHFVCLVCRGNLVEQLMKYVMNVMSVLLKQHRQKLDVVHRVRRVGLDVKQHPMEVRHALIV